MSDWMRSFLGDVIELQRGHDLPGGMRRPGSVPIIGSFGVTGSHDEARYPGPGVAIGRSGAAIGTATYVDGTFWPLNTCLFVRDFKGNDPRWVYRVLDLTDFMAYNSGSAQPSLNRNFLKSIPVLIPPLHEQQGIAEVLGALDDKIAANTNLVASAERLMTALASTASGTTQVGDIARQSTASRKPDEFEFAVAHFSLPAFDDGALPEAAEGQSIKSNKFIVDRPVVLMSKLNPRIPRIWNVPVVPDQMALASTEFVVLVPFAVDVSALWAVLTQPAVSATLTGKVAGTSGSHQRVKPAELLSIEVWDPRTLAPTATESIATLGLIAHARRRESEALASTRDALLPLLMSGKFRVKDTERVVEEVV